MRAEELTQYFIMQSMKSPKVAKGFAIVAASPQAVAHVEVVPVAAAAAPQGGKEQGGKEKEAIQRHGGRRLGLGGRRIEQ